jgi:aromatic-amino-acid transaminase
MFFPPIEMAPADPILGLTEAFRKDPRPGKVNLGVGVFVDDQGATPVPECIKRAERLLWEMEKTKGYTPINGPAEYGDGGGGSWCSGKDFHGLAMNRAVAVAQTPGGTGAPARRRGIAQGLPPARRDRLDARSDVGQPQERASSPPRGSRSREIVSLLRSPARSGVDADAMCAALEKVPAGDIVLLHVCCHNPTGADLDAADLGAGGGRRRQGRLVPVLRFRLPGLRRRRRRGPRRACWR